VVQENKTKMMYADTQVRRERYLRVAQFNNLVTKLAAFSVTNTLLIVAAYCPLYVWFFWPKDKADI
jgi:hypothetical protein